MTAAAGCCGCGCGYPLGALPRAGWRKACRDRWIRAGRPPGGPPPPRPPAPLSVPPPPGVVLRGRMEDWKLVCKGMTINEAAARLGRSRRTIERYLAVERAHPDWQQQQAAA